jgi:hypothetical protein
VGTLRQIAEERGMFGKTKNVFEADEEIKEDAS